LRLVIGDIACILLEGSKYLTDVTSLDVAHADSMSVMAKKLIEDFNTHFPFSLRGSTVSGRHTTYSIT